MRKTLLPLLLILFIFSSGIYLCPAYGKVLEKGKITDAIETKIEHIKQNKEYKRLVRKEKKRRDKELFQKSKFRRILTQIENDESAYRNLDKILSGLGLNGLLREAGKKKNLNDSALDIRILHRLEIDSSGKGWDHLRKDDHKRAILFFEIAARAGIQSHNVYTRIMVWLVLIPSARTRSKLWKT